MIKNIFIFFVLITMSLQSFSQVNSYDETALLFSQEKLNGTARYLAMSGAFGAVGGDLSAIEINPAGMVVFNNSTSSISFDVNKKSNTNNFSNLKSNYKATTLNFAHAGGLIVFNNGSENWNKFAISATTTISNNFKNSIYLNGNNNISNESYFLEPDNTAELYNIVESQKMNNITTGTNSKTTFSIAARVNKKISLGFSVINNSVDFSQDVQVRENSKDINDETFKGVLNQTLDVYGQGIGFNFGLLARPIGNLRLGVSLKTPTWYGLTENFTQNKTTYLSNYVDLEQPDNIDSTFEYELMTPAKFTGSIAYVFGKSGLLSLDYSYKDFGSMHISPNSEFEYENNYINDNLNVVSSLNVGGEYRLKYLSLRGGFHLENTPYKDNENYSTAMISAGFGFKTSSTATLDFAFNTAEYYEKKYYLNTSNNMDLSKNKENKFTVTYSVNF